MVRAFRGGTTEFYRYWFLHYGASIQQQPTRAGSAPPPSPHLQILIHARTVHSMDGSVN
jgi:hypothetical protein